MQYLKADTSVIVPVGPAVAIGDGFTLVTTLDVSTADAALLTKYNNATAVDISGRTFAVYATPAVDGYYKLTLSTADTDTEGYMSIMVEDVSLCLPIRHDFMVVSANVYDALFAAAGTDLLQTDVIEIVSGTVPTPNTTGIPDVNVLEILDTTVSLTTGDLDVNVATIAAGAVSAAAIATDAVDADALAMDAVNEIARAIGIQTNTALSNVPILMRDSTTDAPKTGLTLTITRDIDAAGFGAVDGGTTSAELANGFYQVDIAAADLNGSLITFKFAASGAHDSFITISTVA